MRDYYDVICYKYLIISLAFDYVTHLKEFMERLMTIIENYDAIKLFFISAFRIV